MLVDLFKTIIPPIISVISIIVSAIIVRIKSKREAEMKREEELFNLVREDIKNIKSKLIDKNEFVTRNEFDELKSKINEIHSKLNRRNK